MVAKVFYPPFSLLKLATTIKCYIIYRDNSGLGEITMNEKTFKALLASTATIFTLIFCVMVIPAFFENPDIISAFAAGFVNPFASGYSADVILCWLVLLIWIVHEATQLSVRYGWICLLLGIIPGVAVGFALYLIIRHPQVSRET